MTSGVKIRGVDDYLEINRANWDERAPVHAASPDYNLKGFIDDPGLISAVVRFDRPLLGDVSGLRGVHLQCHIGTDTVSLSRLGARMTDRGDCPRAIPSRLSKRGSASPCLLL